MWSPLMFSVTLNGPNPIGCWWNSAALKSGLGAQDVLRHDDVEEDRPGGERLLEADDGGLLVRRVHGGDLLVAVAGADLVVGLHDRLPGVLDVGRGDRLAVVPGDALAQLVGDRLAVGRDAAVLDARHLLGQLALEGALVVGEEQAAQASAWCR